MARLWLGFSSLGATALLGIAFSVLAAVSAFIPQGWLAEEFSRLDHTEGLRTLYAWGLTDVARSWWLVGVLVLLGGNLVAVIARYAAARRSLPDDQALAALAPHQAELETKLPERAAEAVRAVYGSLFGRPVSERVNGSSVLLAFDTAPRAGLTPLLTHVGLVLLVLGAVLSTRPPPRSDAMVRALLEVREVQSGSMGRFDVAQDEARSFFQARAEHVIRDFQLDRDGLGPAILIVRTDPDQQTRDDFWVYRDAPPGFDARHRRAEVAISASKMEFVPKPGKGLPSRAEGVLLLLGLALLAAGAFELNRPSGRLIAELDGKTVRLSGVPHRLGDPKFQAAFQRWALLARFGLDGA